VSGRREAVRSCDGRGRQDQPHGDQHHALPDVLDTDKEPSKGIAVASSVRTALAAATLDSGLDATNFGTRPRLSSRGYRRAGFGLGGRGELSCETRGEALSRRGASRDTAMLV
jgi:hypothetical protein